MWNAYSLFVHTLDGQVKVCHATNYTQATKPFWYYLSKCWTCKRKMFLMFSCRDCYHVFVYDFLPIQCLHGATRHAVTTNHFTSSNEITYLCQSMVSMNSGMYSQSMNWVYVVNAASIGQSTVLRCSKNVRRWIAIYKFK